MFLQASRRLEIKYDVGGEFACMWHAEVQPILADGYVRAAVWAALGNSIATYGQVRKLPVCGNTYFCIVDDFTEGLANSLFQIHTMKHPHRSQ